MARQVATADVTIYVAPNGSDTNDGLSAATPVHSIQEAVRRLYADWDFAYNHFAYVQLADGVYTEWVSIRGQPVGRDAIAIRGNQVNPAAVQWRAPTNGMSNCSSVEDMGIGVFSGIDFSAPNGGGCLAARQNAVIDMLNCRFGPCSQAHMAAFAATINCVQNYTIYGGAPMHIAANGVGNVLLNGSAIDLPVAGLHIDNFLWCGPSSTIYGPASFTGPGAGAATIGARGLTYAWGSVISLSGAQVPGNAGFDTTRGGQVFVN